MTSKEMLCDFCAQIENVQKAFKKDEADAIEKLSALKSDMEKAISREGEELFSACVYNALATINTAPNQKKKNEQLLEALCEAKAEITEIEKII